MLYLLFELGNDRYALEARHVAEVLPVVEFKGIPGAMRGVLGLFNYRGAPIPLIDLTELALGKCSQIKMSSRIIVTEYVEDNGQRHLIGVLAEQVTETIRRSEADFNDPGVRAGGAPFLGPLLVEESSMIQRVEINRLLPETVRAQLFAALVG
jgi:chemotaxis-related protein WspB